jgi:hypothetical protein
MLVPRITTYVSGPPQIVGRRKANHPAARMRVTIHTITVLKEGPVRFPGGEVTGAETETPVMGGR